MEGQNEGQNYESSNYENQNNESTNNESQNYEGENLMQGVEEPGRTMPSAEQGMNVVESESITEHGTIESEFDSPAKRETSVAESASSMESETPTTDTPTTDTSGQSFSGYTGEYGNRIDGIYREPEQTTYSFSYKNGGGESTHSGDYYAEKNHEETHHEEKRYEEIKAENAGNNDQEYKDAPYFGNYYENLEQSPEKSKKPKKSKEKGESSFGKKLLVTVVCAMLCGLIASACFIGVNYVYKENYGSQKTEQADGTTEIKKTTEQENSVVQKEQAPASGTQVPAQVGTTDVSAIVEQMMPAVVAITSTTKGTAYYDLFGQYYAGRDTTSAGTGFIVGKNEKELLIATNNHVISKAKTISVQFFDNEIYEAAEKGSDAANDLAVVAVKISDVKKSTIEKIRVADLGDSDKAKVGEMVIAIGNALGYGQSVTVGYISAKDREITEESEDGSAANKIKALQTDAAINPGNSGGALINMQGQVIGINSAKIASSQVEGVGYAIPISVATPIIDDLMNREILKDDEKGYLGISGTTVSEAAAMYNVPLGVYVKEVSKGGAAQLAGIKENDIITAVNNMQVTTIESLRDKVNSYRVGTEVEITFQRSSDGEYKEQKVKVKLQGQSSTDGLTDNTEEKDSTENDDSGNDGNEDNNGNNNGNGSRGYDDGFGSLWDFFQ